jgi:hypothetical protein
MRAGVGGGGVSAPGATVGEGDAGEREVLGGLAVGSEPVEVQAAATTATASRPTNVRT